MTFLTLLSQAGGGTGGLIQMVVLFGLIFVVIYFMMIRPQRRQAKERETMITALKKNDQVLTSSGIYGIVDKVRDHDIVLKIDEKSDVRMRVTKTAIATVIKESAAGEKKVEPEQSKK